MPGVSTAELRILITAQDYASAQLAKTVSGMSSLATKATETGAQMTRALTLPAGLIGGSIIKEAADFERTLDVLTNTTREAGKNTEDAAAGFDNAATRTAAFRKEALALGADLKIPATSAADAATAMDELSKAGLSVTQTLAAARGTVQLAAAFGVEESKAADIVSASLLAFGMRGEEASHVANMLARATEVSRAKFADFTVAIRQGAGAFKVTGRPFEEFLGMIGVLVDRGVSGGVAATSLRRAVTAVAAPTAKASATMKQYGIDLFDTEGKLKAWPDIIDDLNTAFKDLNPKETFGAIKDIFGQEGFKSIAPLLNASQQTEAAMEALDESFKNGEISAEEFRAAQEKLTASGGKFTDQLREKIATIKDSNAAELIAAARTKGFWGMLDGLQSSLETVAVTLGTPFLDRLSTLGRGIATLTTEFGAFMAEHPRLVEFVATFGAVVAAVGPAIFLFGRFLTLIMALATPLGIATVAIAAFAAAWDIDYQGIQQRTNNLFDAVRGGIDKAGEAFHEWGGITGDAEAAVGESLSGMSGLMLAFQFAMQQNWPAAQKALEGAMASFGRAFDHGSVAFGNFVSDIITAIGDLAGVDVRGVTGWVDKLGALFDIDVSSVSGTWNQLVAIAQTIMARISAVFSQGLNNLGGFLGIDVSQIEGNWNKLGAIAQGIVDKVKGIFTQTLDNALNFLGIDPAAIEGNWRKLVTIAQTVYNDVSAIFGKALTTGAGLFGIDLTSTEGNWNKLKEVADKAATAIEAASVRISAALKKIGEAEGPPVTEKLSWLDKLKDAAPGLVLALRGVESTIKNVVESFSTLFDILVDLRVIQTLAYGLAAVATAFAAISFAVATSLDGLRTFIRIIMDIATVVGKTIRMFGELAAAATRFSLGDITGGQASLAEAGKAYGDARSAEVDVEKQVSDFLTRFKERLQANSKSTSMDIATALFGDMPTEPAQAAGEKAGEALAQGAADAAKNTAVAAPSLAPVTTAVDDAVKTVEQAAPKMEAASEAVGAGATAGMGSGLQQLPPTVDGVMKDVGDTFGNIGQELAAAGPAVAQGASETIGTVAEEFRAGLPDIQGTATDVVNTISGAFTSAQSTLGQAGQDAGHAIEDGFSAAYATVEQDINIKIERSRTAWAKTLVDFGNDFAPLGDAFNGLLDIIRPVDEQVQSSFQSISTSIFNAVQGIPDKVQSTFDSVSTSIVTTVQAIPAQVESAFNTVAATITSTTQAIQTQMMAFGAQLDASMQTAWTAVQTTVTTAMTAINAVVQSSFATLVSVVTTAGAQINTVMQTAWTAIQTSAATTWASITSTVQTAAATIQSVVTAAGVSMTAAISTAGTNMTAAITSAGTSMISSMTSSMNGMISAATTGISGVISAVSGMAGQAAAAGASIGTSIATGLSGAIRSGAAAAASAAAGAVSSAIAAARAAADAHSPSRKMAALGTDMIDGLAQALSNGQSRVADAVKTIIKEAIAANIDPMVALALAKAESQFNARASGDSGHSIGLFQLHDAGQGAGMSRADREDPTTNARKFLQSHKELFAQLKGEISDTTELVRRFGVAAEQPADQTGAAYAAAYQQIREQIAAAGGSVAELADNQDAFNAALGQSEETTASITPLLERQLALKEQMASIDVQMLAGAQNLERLNRSIQQVEGGSFADRKAALAGNRQDNAFLQQELQLKLMLAKAEAAAPKDDKTGKSKGSQEVADIKAALELLGQKREEISLNAQLTKAENEARAMGLKEQALLQEEALRPLEDQKFLVGQQAAQIDALNTAWEAAQATIQNQTSTENAARREVIATMREQAGANTDIIGTGQAALQEMLNSGRITQQEFERYTAILNQFGQTATTATTNAATGITTVATASGQAGTSLATTGAALATAGQNMQAVGQAGAQAGQTLATTAAQGLATFAADAAVTGNDAAVAFLNGIYGQVGGAYNAGYSVGLAVGQGLQAGVIESGNAAIEAAVAVANAVIEAMRGPEGFDAHSPARKSYFIGQDVMDGLILGLQNPSVSDTVKKRIQQYIDYAERYRQLIPEAIDNELAIINTRIEQAKGLLGILDLEMRMKDAQRDAEDARKGSVDDQLRLLAIDKQRNELRLQEMDHQKAVEQATRALEQTQKQIKDIEEGTLEERVRQLGVDNQRNILKQQELVLQHEIAKYSTVVEQTEKAIADIKKGSLADQYRTLAIEHERAEIRHQELAQQGALIAAQSAVEKSQRIIRDLERGSLADRLHELDIDNQKNMLSKERIQIEARLRQIHEAGIAKDLAAFSGSGLQVVDPSDPLQQEVNQLHNKLALLDDQNELLDDEGQIRELNGKIASYEYRVQLETQQDSLQVLQDQADALDKQNALLQLESDIRENNAELASYALEVQLVGQKNTLDAMKEQEAALTSQIDLLEYEGSLREANANIAKYALLVQQEYQQDALDKLEAQQQFYDDQNAALDQEAERIRIANELRAYGAAQQVIVLEDEHQKQQRVIDDLDRQYEALNRQKQVYDAILRVVDYLHDHLIDEGIIADPFAQDPHEPTGPTAGGGAGSGAKAGGAAAKAGGALAKSGEAITKSMTDAKTATETFTGNAAAALAKLKPVVTDTSTSFDGVTTATEVMATDTVAAVDGMGAEVAAAGEAMSTGYKASVMNMGEAVITTTKDTAGNVITTTADMSGQVISQYAQLANGAKLNTVDMANTVMTTTTAMGDGVVTTTRDLSGNVITTMTDLAGNVTGQYVTLASAVVTAATDQKDGVIAQADATATGMLDIFGRMATDVATQTGTMATDTVTAIDGMATDGATAVGQMATDAITAAEQMASGVATQADTMATDAVTSAEDMATDVAAAADTMNTDAVTSAEDMATDAASAADDMATDVAKAADTMNTDAGTAADSMGTDVVTATEDMATDATAAADGMNTDVVTAVETMATDAATAVQTLGTDAATAIQTMGTDAATAADTMATDVATAADTMATDVGTAVGDMVGEVSDSLGEIEEPAQAAVEALEAIGDVEIPAPDVSDVIDAMDEIKKAAKKAADAVKDAGDAGDKKGDDKGDDKGGDKGDAVGGVVSRGQAYTVGEFGRELFVPWTKGYIMPHDLSERVLATDRARDAMRNYAPIQLTSPDEKATQQQQTRTTVNNFKVEYTAMNQEKKGESDVQQVLRDTIMLLNIGGS